MTHSMESSLCDVTGIVYRVDPTRNVIAKVTGLMSLMRFCVHACVMCLCKCLNPCIITFSCVVVITRTSNLSNSVPFALRATDCLNTIKQQFKIFSFFSILVKTYEHFNNTFVIYYYYCILVFLCLTSILRFYFPLY